MATANELVIKINGDIKSFEDALSKAQAKTEDFSEGLSKAAKISGLAFAALTAEVGLSTHAFAESQKATNQLTQALQNQGIYSKDLIDDYQRQATALQNLTGVSDEAILKAQTTVQASLGQRKVTEDLTKSILDLSVAKGMDLQSTAELVGKGIEGHTMALKKLGIEVEDNLNKDERLAKIIDQINRKFGDQADAAGKGLGALNKMKESFSDLQEEIGKRFAPAIEAVANFFAKLFQTISGNKALVDFTASMLIAGGVVTGAITTLSLAGIAFLKLKAALEAAKVATSAMSIAIKGLAGATGLGLIALAISEIYFNWNSIWPRMQAAFKAFVDNIGTLGGGLATILKGIFTLDKEMIKKGLDEAKSAFTKGLDEYKDITKEKLDEVSKIEEAEEQKKVDRNNKNAAAEQARIEAQERAKLDRIRAENQLKVLEQENATAQSIDLKKKEVEALKLIEDENYKGNKEVLRERAEELREMQKTQGELDLEAKRVYQDELLTDNEDFQKLSDEQQDLFHEQNDKKAVEQVESEKSIRLKMAQDRLNEQIKSNNQYLVEQQKFGTAYATINRAMHSEIYQGTKQAFGEMAQLQQSQNNTLKAIGKVAAVANIIIKTAESAMNIFAGFSTIPFVGPALGAAAAAAAVAFGAEQVSRVTAAADGGLLTGGMPGVDSIPVLAQQGELISPRQNFEEVIGSVRAARAAEKLGVSASSPQVATNILVGFDSKEASQIITVKQIEDRALGISQEMTT